jgi:hypothetical protein
LYEILKINNIAKNKNKSLTLLNENALNAAFKVPTLVAQKLIKKNEVRPISSHPRNSIIKFPDDTKNTILITNKFSKISNLSTKGSYLKYEKVYRYTNNAIDKVKNEKLKEILSIKKLKFTLKLELKYIHLPKFM